jgi:dihydrofolate reductase
MTERKICCILAINKKGVIGHNGKLPWHLPDDLARFKRIVSGNTMVIGLRTHESIQEFRGAAVRTHDRKVKEAWDNFDKVKVEIIAAGHSEAKQKRLIQQAQFRCDQSLGLIDPVYFPHSLPNRLTIVVSTTMVEPSSNPNIRVARSPEEAIAIWQREGKGNLYVAGGAKLYEAFWDKMELLHLTIVENEVDGDTKFPFELQGAEWRQLAKQTMRDDKENITHVFHVLAKKV